MIDQIRMSGAARNAVPPEAADRMRAIDAASSGMHVGDDRISLTLSNEKNGAAAIYFPTRRRTDRSELKKAALRLLHEGVPRKVISEQSDMSYGTLNDLLTRGRVDKRRSCKNQNDREASSTVSQLGRGCKQNAERKAQVLRRVALGKSDRLIAEETGLKYNTVRVIRARAGVLHPVERKVYTPEQQELALRLSQEGVRRKVISKQLEMPYETLKDLLKRGRVNKRRPLKGRNDREVSPGQPKTLPIAAHQYVNDFDFDSLDLDAILEEMI